MAAVRDLDLIWNPLPEAGTQPGITPWQWIVHTAVDAPGPTNLGSYFEHHTNLESHTWLRFGGAHEQLVPFNRSADANYQANRFYVDGQWRGAISTETEDDGSPEENPWDAEQIAELIRFGVWLNKTFGIPPRLPKGPFDPGMGYHVLHPRHWTTVVGKTCPGSTRIHQFLTVVLPGIQQAINASPQEDDLVFTLDEARAYVREFYRQIAQRDAKDDEVEVWAHAIAADPREMWKLQARLVGEHLRSTA